MNIVLEKLFDKELINQTLNPNYKYYVNAYESYKKIYNQIMARGEGNFDPKVLEGKPITINYTNMEPFLTEKYYIGAKADGRRFMMMFSEPLIDEDTEFEHSNRLIYFVDSTLNFWILKSYTNGEEKIFEIKDIGNCLIDGELLLFGSVKRVYNKNNEIEKYILQPEIHDKVEYSPFVSFLSFDILYGPMQVPDPDKENKRINWGNMAALMGFKKYYDIPTIKRRTVLEEMFNNPRSTLKMYNESYVKDGFKIIINKFLDKDELVNVFYDSFSGEINFSEYITEYFKDYYFNNIKNQLDIESQQTLKKEIVKLLNENEIYENIHRALVDYENAYKINKVDFQIKNILPPGITNDLMLYKKLNEYLKLLIDKVIPKNALNAFLSSVYEDIKKEKSHDDLKNVSYNLLDKYDYRILPYITTFLTDNLVLFKNEKIDKMYDNGLINKNIKQIKYLESKISKIKIKCIKEQHPLKTDGLIFTPKYTHYIVGTWNNCKNRLYKWKPSKDSTIDVKLVQSGSVYTLFYDNIIKKNDFKKLATQELIYNGRKCILINNANTLIYPDKIYEVIPEKYNDKEIVFKLIRQRDDKNKTNAYFTINSLIDSFILGNENILNNISKLIFYENTKIKLITNDQIKTIIESFSNERKQKLLTYIKNDYLNKNQLQLLKKDITNVFSNENKNKEINEFQSTEQEIEARISFNNKVDISCFFIKRTENKYINKIYLNNNYRIIYDIIGNEIIVESVIHKATTNKIVCDKFNKMYKFTSTSINNSIETSFHDFELTLENVNYTKEILKNIFTIDNFSFLESNNFNSFYDIVSFLITPFNNSKISINNKNNISELILKIFNYKIDSEYIFKKEKENKKEIRIYDIILDLGLTKSKKYNIYADLLSTDLSVSYQVQSRYIDSSSNYWLVEYIEYGVSNNSIEEARNHIEQNYYIFDINKTKEENEKLKYENKLFRIEIELKPYYKTIENIRDLFLLHNQDHKHPLLKDFNNMFLQLFDNNEDLLYEIKVEIEENFLNFKKYEKILSNELIKKSKEPENEAIHDLIGILFKTLYTYDES